jgi:hypothetical protein
MIDRRQSISAAEVSKVLINRQPRYYLLRQYEFRSNAGESISAAEVSRVLIDRQPINYLQQQKYQIWTAVASRNPSKDQSSDCPKYLSKSPSPAV